MDVLWGYLPRLSRWRMRLPVQKVWRWRRHVGVRMMVRIIVRIVVRGRDWWQLLFYEALFRAFHMRRRWRRGRIGTPSISWRWRLMRITMRRRNTRMTGPFKLLAVATFGLMFALHGCGSGQFFDNLTFLVALGVASVGFRRSSRRRRCRRLVDILLCLLFVLGGRSSRESCQRTRWAPIGDAAFIRIGSWSNGRRWDDIR